MANRRMISKAVIDTDLFMEMPISTQCLYFHLLLASDDDGFVASPKRIVRMLGVAEDDMRLLIAKGFAYAFQSGIVVIRHWFVHNQLRRDRYTPTVWPEKSMIELDGRNVYQLISAGVDPSGNQVATNGCQNGNHLAPQVRLGKDSIGKISIGKERGGGAMPEEATTPFSEILSLYHSLCPSLRPVKVLTTRRMAAMEELYALLGGSMEAIKEYFRRCANTPFLCGENRLGWVANLDFLLKPDKYAKIAAGTYDNEKEDFDGGKGEHGADGGDRERSGGTAGQVSSLAADCEAFERGQNLPTEL